MSTLESRTLFPRKGAQPVTVVGAGVDIRFNERAGVAEGITVFAIGPRVADATALA